MDYRIFVGAFPTGELAERIQSVRLHYDPKTARITPPHVTLAGTYWRSGPPTPANEAAAIQTLQNVQNRIRPFDLILQGMKAFPPDTRPVIHLGVEASESLLHARKVLLDALGADKHRRFTPHLTLAMRLSGTAAERMVAELSVSEWTSGRFAAPIHELRLIQRGPDDPAWRCIFRFPLQS